MKETDRLNEIISELKTKIEGYENEIRDLKWKLDDERALTEAVKSMTENGMLPPKGVECTGCKHCIVYVNGLDVLAIGCDKDISCKDFEPSEHVAKRFEGRHKWGKTGRINGEVTIPLNSVNY